MNNITQNTLFNLLNANLSNTLSLANNLICPFDKIPSIFNYANLNESLANDTRKLQLNLLKHTLESMDLAWRNRPDRVNSYYVKCTRERTMITLFGVLTYQRTIYQNRHTKQCFCYVDHILGFAKYERYDPCVKAEMARLYTDHNSMIKVGRILGKQIFQPFSSKECEIDYAIPRQTIQRSILSFGMIHTKHQPFPFSPSSLYLMADEKWVPLQSHHSDGSKQKQMVKEVVIFEDIAVDAKNTSTSYKRHKLVNKTRITASHSDIWGDVYSSLGELYDIDSIRNLHVMGDGANWIKAGVRELSDSHYTVDFTLDSFHLNQALLRISNDADIRATLHNLIFIDKDKHLFEVACLSLMSEHKDRAETIEFNMKYILNNWKYIMRRIDEVTMPCAMEGSISHDIASFTSSVPKAYMRQHLNVYMNHRIHYLNGAQMTNLFLQAFDKRKDGEIEIDIHDTLFFPSPSSLYQQPKFLRDISSYRHYS